MNGGIFGSVCLVYRLLYDPFGRIRLAVTASSVRRCGTRHFENIPSHIVSLAGTCLLGFLTFGLESGRRDFIEQSRVKRFAAGIRHGGGERLGKIVEVELPVRSKDCMKCAATAIVTTNIVYQ